MSKRIFDKIPLLIIQNKFRNSSNTNLLQPFRYNLKSTYIFQNKFISFSTTFVSINDVRNVSHLRYYSDSSSPSNNDNVSFDVLQQLLNEKNKGKQKNVCIIDVREPFELIDGHIPYAINIPLNEFEEGKVKKKKNKFKE
jgi:hypothetical protein